MEIIQNEWIILSDIEVTLCIRLLGGKDWNDFLLVKTNQGKEQEILNAFLHLTQLGLIESSKNGYFCGAKLKELLYPVVNSKEKILICQDGLAPIQIYGYENKFTVFKRLQAEATRASVCRLDFQSLYIFLNEEFDNYSNSVGNFKTKIISTGELKKINIATINVLFQLNHSIVKKLSFKIQNENDFYYISEGNRTDNSHPFTFEFLWKSIIDPRYLYDFG
jgi:hypothetical protein